MTPEEKSLLERTYKLSEENNKILRKMRRSSRISGVIRALYWIVIIGITIGAYYYVQPYLENVLQMYDQARSSLNQLQGEMNTVQNATNTLKNVVIPATTK